MVKDLMRKGHDAFALKRAEHSRAIKDFRFTFRQTTLFRTQMHDFLCALDQEHRLDDLDALAGKNQRLIKSLNKELPVEPKWSDAVSDEQMRFTVACTCRAPDVPCCSLLAVSCAPKRCIRCF